MVKTNKIIYVLRMNNLCTLFHLAYARVEAGDMPSPVTFERSTTPSTNSLRSRVKQMPYVRLFCFPDEKIRNERLVENC